MGSFPDTISTKTWTHFVQLVKNNAFCQFNYGFTHLNYLRYGNKSPPCYNMGNIGAPFVIFYGQNDIFDVPQVSGVGIIALMYCFTILNCPYIIFRMLLKQPPKSQV